MKDDKPMLRGSVEIPVPHLADFGLDVTTTPDTAEATRDVPATPHIFSHESLDIGFMNDIDLELALAIDEVKGRELIINSVIGNLRLNNGNLSITPLRLLFQRVSSENCGYCWMTVTRLEMAAQG